MYPPPVLVVVVVGRGAPPVPTENGGRVAGPAGRVVRVKAPVPSGTVGRVCRPIVVVTVVVRAVRVALLLRPVPSEGRRVELVAGVGRGIR